MLLKQMKYFVTIVRCHSFTEAAEECFISQSAISQQIKALEDDLGVQLMIREKRSFTLTPAGEYFYRHCLGVIDEIERITVETKQIHEYKDQYLSIGFLEGTYNHEVQRALAAFSRVYPEVTLDVKTGAHEDIYHMLQSGEINCGLNDQRRAFSDAYVNYHLTYSPCYIELSNQNPLSQLSYLTKDDLRRLPCILISSIDQEETERAYYSDILGFGDHYLFTRNQETARLLVAANKGYRCVNGEQRHYETLVYIPLYDGGQQLTRRYCLFWRKDKSSYYNEELAKYLYDSFNQESTL